MNKRKSIERKRDTGHNGRQAVPYKSHSSKHSATSNPKRRPQPGRSSITSQLPSMLRDAYPDASTELAFTNNYQLVIAVVLSAQCTDKKVNEVTPALFATYSSFKALAQAKLTAVEEIIRPINYYRTKARNIIALAEAVCRKHGGELPSCRAELISLPGVGRKTANVILCELGTEPALPVDTHVLRLANRLGLSAANTADRVEQDLTAIFPPDSWRHLHHALILHGRRVCKARRPLCNECALQRMCPSATLIAND